MSNKPKTNKTKTKKNRKHSLSFYAIIISLLILAIPATFLAVSGISSLRGRGKPVVGNRFNNDHDPAIKEEDIKTLISQIEGLEYVSKANANLASATLRIYVLDESLTTDSLESKQKEIYELVNGVLDIESYFTKTGAKKQYDLEIHLFNLDAVNETNEESYVYGLYVKNSNMTEPYTQTLSEPLSQEMVDYFYETEAYYEDLENQEYEEEELDNEDDVEVEGEEE